MFNFFVVDTIRLIEKPKETLCKFTNVSDKGTSTA